MWNLFFNVRWGVLALGLYILHLWLGIPLYISIAGFGVWLFIALFATGLIVWGARISSGDTQEPPRENKNPYSADTADVFPLREKKN